MKNQDIFEVFKHLKTLLGSNPQKKSHSATDSAVDKSNTLSTQNNADKEKRLRDFHLKHEALSRKITAANLKNPLPQGTVISLREKRAEASPSAQSVLTKNEENKADTTPLFPPSFP